jgi:hypothetical protein
MPARQGSRHRDGQPSNGGDAVFVIRDDGLCSLTKELTLGTGDPRGITAS